MEVDTMAKNNFSLKSLADLEKMADSYGTSIASFLQEQALSQYQIADVSKEEFANITTFINNAVIKDGSIIELNETSDSLFFSKMLRKYFEEFITINDLINLKNFVNDFNQDRVDLIYENVYRYVFGVDELKQGIEADSIFSRIVSIINKKIEQLLAEWFERKILYKATVAGT
jgi:hypothetical protein